MRFTIGKLALDANGAVAPTVALSLFGLIAVGGIAFDYARLSAMDTELQDAADQAALAAASQLDKQTGACARAAAAASNLLANNTLFAQPSSTTGTGIEVPTSGVTTCAGNSAIQFYQTYNQDTDTPGAVATSDANAKFVVVSVTPRESFYALTPIVAAFDPRARSSGQIGATAVATLNSAICKMPPVMICNPDETTGGSNFNPSLYIGKGLRLTSVGGGGGGWVPGNFGYLDTNVTEVSGQVNQLRASLGWNNPPGDCTIADGVDTKPGATTTVTDAINTRFDIFENQNNSCYGSGTCSPAVNSTKDVIRPANATGAAACRLTGANAWQLASTGTYYGSGNFPSADTNNDGVTDAYADLQMLPTSSTPDVMGYPRDLCHAVNGGGGICPGGYEGRIGDGKWDRDAYFRVNYKKSGGGYWTGGTAAGSWQANTGLPANATRYQVYSWEIAHSGLTIDGVTILGPRTVSGSGANALTSYGVPQCGAGQASPDRRRISVAVVNCQANNVGGNSAGVPVEKWIDVFLVEPSINRQRTSNGDLYAEIIGETVNGGNNATQVVVHQVPHLVK
jgi:Flp pilus assembly protein TadG